jgi:hypothetical protein
MRSDVDHREPGRILETTALTGIRASRQASPRGIPPVRSTRRNGNHAHIWHDPVILSGRRRVRSRHLRGVPSGRSLIDREPAAAQLRKAGNARLSARGM